MHIVLPGAWPEPEVAAELASHVSEQAPTLLRMLQRGTASIQASPFADTWCTATEAWLLQACGHSPAESEHLSAGLGPLRAPEEKNGPVWLAELIHMSPSRDGAALLPGDTLAISEEHSRALLDEARLYQDEGGLTFSFLGPALWRVHWQADDKQAPQAASLPCASPTLVSMSSVNDWWPEQTVARPWRRLVNTLQMAWHEHPVNQARAAQGLPPINSLWLFGGARPEQLTRPLPPDTRVLDQLHDTAMRQDWGSWIHVLAQLDRDHLAKVARQQPVLVLGGRERFVTLRPNRLWWLRPGRHTWRQWWNKR